MLDPGHGGVDPGASRGGVREKDIALAFGLEFAAMLEDTGRYDVALTRRDDRFLLLDDRVAPAVYRQAILLAQLRLAPVVALGAAGEAGQHIELG